MQERIPSSPPKEQNGQVSPFFLLSSTSGTPMACATMSHSNPCGLTLVFTNKFVSLAIPSFHFLRIPSSPPFKKIRFDTIVSDLFSLHKGFISLSVNEYQSLVGVFNHTFAGLFFFIYNNYGTKASSTERF